MATQLIEIRNGRPFLAEDRWVHLSEDAKPAAEGPATISLARWRSGRDILTGRNLPLGIRLESDERIDEILPRLDDFELIALNFPNLNDGRHFTSARLLRERYGYRGQIRAIGQVLRDQLDLMRRCGFDAFELPAGRDAAAALAAFGEISVVYQPAGDRRPTAAWLRHRPQSHAVAG
jgi:uncharacterized protein (DUF934 family)